MDSTRTQTPVNAMEKNMKYGARKGRMNFWRRWLANAISRELVIFPIPGADLLRMYLSEPLNREVRLAENPKEANVLLIIGDLSLEMAERASTIYAQMPRPRVLVMAGPNHLSPLPHPEIHVSLEIDFLEHVLPAARECLRSFSWMEEVEPYRPEKLVKENETAGGDHGHMHHNHGHDHSTHDHSDHGKHEHGHENHDHSAHDHSSHGKHEHGHEGHDHSAHDHSSHGKHEHGHEGHDHGSGFMSMKAMTKGLPLSADGLPMEWSNVQFGPFHPGLPGGLRLSMKLDGDTVAKAVAEQSIRSYDLPATVKNDPASLPEYLEATHPDAPVSYRLLAQKALENYAGKTADTKLNISEAILLEKERVISHLNWLAVFGTSVGSEWMYNQAIKHYYRFKKDQGNASLISGFISRIKKVPYLKLKLTIPDHRHLEKKDHILSSNKFDQDYRTHNHNHSDQTSDEHPHSEHDHSEHNHKMQSENDHSNHIQSDYKKNDGHDHSTHLHSKASDENAHSHEKPYGHEHHKHGRHDHSDHEHSEHGHEGHSHHHSSHSDKEEHDEHHHHGHEDHSDNERHENSHRSIDEKELNVVHVHLPDNITGPVARAAGIERDHRLEEPVYQQGGWAPETTTGNNAWSRLMVRLNEMEQSLRFITDAGNDSGGVSSQKIDIPSTGMGNGIAHIESPRGTLKLKFHIHEGKIAHFQLNAPSEALVEIIQQDTEQLELADALTAVSSLDISPREIYH